MNDDNRKLNFEFLRTHAGQKPAPGNAAHVVPMCRAMSYTFNNARMPLIPPAKATHRQPSDDERHAQGVTLTEMMHMSAGTTHIDNPKVDVNIVSQRARSTV